MDVYNLVSFLGMFVFLALAWALSTNRRCVNWRVLGWGVGLQLLLALVVFRLPGSSRAFVWLNDAFLKLLAAASHGQRFLFGPLGGQNPLGFILAFQALPVIIFFSALMALLYYVRVMPLIIRGFAWVFTRLMRISGAESLCAASNIFVGIESATTVRPYLRDMTRSEFCTILTAGMATVASSTMGVYVLFLDKVFPTIAGHLISASILSAPAAIVMSKILMPEDGVPLTMGRHLRLSVERGSGAIESVINGATAGVKLVVGICALLVAFLGLVALANLLINWGTVLMFAAVDKPVPPEVLQVIQHPLEWLFGRVMAPFALVIGVPASDALFAGKLLGERLFLTEIPAYQHLAEAMQAGALADPRTPVVLAYALCGFAHVGSLAIFVGGIAALVPERRKDLAAVGPRALLAATLACLMTGAVAGTFYHGAATVLRAAPG